MTPRSTPPATGRFSRSFYLLAVLTVLWFALITYLSHQNPDQSNEQSLGLTSRILIASEEVSGQTDIGWEDDLRISGFINLLLRDLAHVGAFFGLSYLLTATLLVGRLNILPGIVFSCLWSVFDESSKLLVRGRHAEIKDMLLNLAGALFGLLFLHLTTRFLRRLRARGSSLRSRSKQHIKPF